jgi:uncharacterized protein (TIGR02145 family)
MKRFTLIFVLLFVAMQQISAQVPQRFSYQAVLRNADGTTFSNQTVDIRINLRRAIVTGDIVYSEVHNVTITNGTGTVSLSIGGGTVQSGSFATIPWGDNIFIQMEVKTAGHEFQNMGTSQILSVPYAIVAGNVSQPGSQGQSLVYNGTQWVANDRITISDNSVDVTTKDGRDTEKPIFAVRNSFNQIIFAVYESGVRIFLPDEVKGSKGGFAVGGLTNQAKGGNQEYLRITPDSARINVNQSLVKGSKGGFAVGGLTNQGKSVGSQDLLFISPDSTRIYVNESGAKGSKGGFAVGGLTNQGKSVVSRSILFASSDSTRIYVNESSKGSKGGFAVGGLSGQGKSSGYHDLLFVGRDSSRIYVNENSSTGAHGGFAVGGIGTQGQTNGDALFRVTKDTSYFNNTVLSTNNILANGTFIPDAINAAREVKDGDGNIYTPVKIGAQTWLKENLKTTHYNDKTYIPFSDRPIYPGDTVLNLETYGRHYTENALKGGNVCPDGFHVATPIDWETLMVNVGGVNWAIDPTVTGLKLMENGTALNPGGIWSNTNATNESGFTARPGGGYRNFDGWYFAQIGSDGYWWSYDTNASEYVNIYGYSGTVSVANLADVSDAFSVRCVK